VSSTLTLPEPKTAAERRIAALAVAETCIQILQKDYGATEAFVFGSLRGDSPWHAASDLDLAVRGMSAWDVMKAHYDLRSVVPEWLPFDIAPVDTLSGRIRQRILGELPMPENPYLALKERLLDEMEAIEQSMESLNEALLQRYDVAEFILTPALTSYVDDFYSGCERMAKRVAVALDGKQPKGESWHMQLLQQLASTGGQGRPPLWSRELHRDLIEYCRFRHRIRHIYTGELQPLRVMEMAEGAAEVFKQLQMEVHQFIQWLEAQV